MLDELRIRCCHGPDATTAEERGAKRHVAVAQQRLVFRGQQLVDGSKLYDSGIFDGAVVHLVVFTRVQPPPQPLPPI